MPPVGAILTLIILIASLLVCSMQARRLPDPAPAAGMLLLFVLEMLEVDMGSANSRST
ncbi:hypothetical protein FOPG_19544 [Fusarium oxysporum f. sp. conglutinans race 2 54008]|uniref:Uncharacterized protein n=1 Tax=Fusarium oxysporum f. sp. conglutinans race 2 54008 TaxID=1089457 RepID=X0GW93_FUSOX|nr:hypothetical protein FOPG_19544 [Fusarium oxysporum f. sp. conglutinans race 2 54008]